MEKFGVFNEDWKWLLLESLWCSVAAKKTASGFSGFIRRHWPNVCYAFGRLGNLLRFSMIQWKDCLLRGCKSVFDLGTAALFIIIWSCFLSLTSMSCLLYLLLSMVTAVCAVRYLGYTPGLLMVGLFTILILRMYANFWIAGSLLIFGGFLFSLNHTRFVVLVAMVYALYYVKHQVGWSGVLVSINLAFLSCDALTFMLQWCDNLSEKSETTQFEEPKVPESFLEDDITESKFRVNGEEDEHEQVNSCKSSSNKPTFMNKEKKESKSTISIPVVKTHENEVNEMERIISCVDHYETLGFTRYDKIDAILLKKEYKKKAMLVHPDKNMGNPLASESFKKVQCAYEILSDSIKKRDYDDHLRNQDSKTLFHKSASSSHQETSDYFSDESRRIHCTKCDLMHIWVCTNRSKSKARWCQDCCQYHQAKDGDGWVEYKGSLGSDQSQKMEIPRAFVCAQSKIFDVSEWAICQGMACRPNTHRPTFQVNMVGLEKSQKCKSNLYPWDLDAQMTDEEEEFDLWLQQAVASGLFCESSKSRKNWTPFKFSPKKVKQQWTRMSRWSH
ncbi:uncharacterized protein LOC111884725 [Lactuca sativa]|uniref:uncharacterized protein LOC111884725 n=1 Tax=Lactuca sativa TaxID=4236 RepID=UPI000CD8F72B|nr:uncharacterized protein LOC111884725 [Lactuca sativa]